MTQDELIRRLAEEADLFLYQARRVLECLPGIIEEAVAEGDTVRLTGLGTFRAQDFAPKVGRNPGTGEEVPIPVRRSLVFKPTKRMKDLETCREALGQVGDFEFREANKPLFDEVEEAQSMPIKDTFDKVVREKAIKV